MSLHDIAARALHALDPEDAHRAAVLGLKLGLGPVAPPTNDPALAVTIAGLTLPNPVGLAAGFDKDAEVSNAMLRAGFGFVECGTVTPLPQTGNARPRLFRLTEDRAVVTGWDSTIGGLTSSQRDWRRGLGAACSEPTLGPTRTR